MKRAPLIAAVAMSAAAAAWSAAAESPVPPSADGIAKAKAAAKDLGEGLKAQLVAALKAGGPSAALTTCKTIGQDFTAATGKTHGLVIKRTALRVRNASNAPDEFERKVLTDFGTMIAAGVNPAELEHAEVVTEGGKSQLRYMKPIPMAAEPCQTCHGPSVAPELKAEIDKLYPGDQAVGFKPGELRGAFSITQDLP